MNLTVGQKAQRTLEMTPLLVQAYAEITGDYNPLHFNAQFATGAGFAKAVVQNGLTTGLVHALVAMDMPGPGAVFLSQNWQFTGPVYIGDTITAEAEVLAIQEAEPIAHLRVRVTRQTGDTVLEGEARCYTYASKET